MTPSLLFLLIIISIIGKSKNCNVVEIESNEKFISQRSNILLIESDTQEYEHKNYTNFIIINESLRIQSFQDEHIISTLIIEYFGFRSIEDQLFCKFIKTYTYFISCIKVINFYANDRLNYLNEQNIIEIELSDLNRSQCQEFFINSQSEFILICFQNFHLQIYCINQDNKILLLQQYKINQNQYEICKIKYFKQDDNYYIISFYHCENWAVYTYWQQEIKELLNQDKINSIEISYLENIQICQNRIILILQTGYLQFYINKMNQALYEIFFEYPQYLKYILFSQNCFMQCYIQYHQQTNNTIIFYNNQTLQSFEGTDYLFELLGNILFVQSQNQLQVIYNQQYQQIIKFNISYIGFNNYYNLIYWFDEITKQIIFYKLSYPRNLIEPSKKYIFQIENFFYFQNILIQCNEIKYNMQPKLIKTFDFYYQCQNKYSLLYSKTGLQIPYYYEIKVDQTYLEFGINILDQHSFLLICPKIQNLQQQDTILLYYETNTSLSFSVIKTTNYIYFQNCNDVNKFKIYIKDYQVYTYQSSLLIYNQNKKELKLIQFRNQQIKEFKIDSQIISILQCQQIVLIFTSENKDLKVIDLQNNYLIVLNQEMNQMLNKLNQMYLQDKQIIQNQVYQHFFYSQQHPKYFQYNQYLMIQNQLNIELFRLEYIQIIFLKETLNQQQYILGVHLINNQIFEYYFDYEQISKISSLNQQDYQFIRPLKYQINNNYFAIATQNQTKIFVLIYEIRITKPPLLIKVIQISRIQFFFKGDQLFYYNLEDEIKIYNMLYIEIQLENLILQYNEIIINTKVNFSIISANKSDPIINLGFILKSYNECYQLFQISNHISINSNQELISKYFYGPIEQLKIQYNDRININGPLLLYQFIYQNNQYDNNRIKNIDITSILQNNQDKQSIILYYDDFGQTFILNQENIQFNKIISINESSILILFQNNQKLSVRAIIYLIDQDNQKLRQDPILDMNLNLKLQYTEYHISKTGDLIIFKSQSHLLFYMILNYRIQFIENDLNILEILKIQGNNNKFYISLSQLNNRINYQFQVLYINEYQLISIGTVILLMDTILNELNNYIPISQYLITNYQNQFYFLECNISDQDVRILMFQIFNQVSIISQINININNQQISYKVQKILRHGLEQGNMILQFYNKNTIILKSYSNYIYFYDLQEDLKYFDYIGRIINQNINSYYPLNTTHLIVFQSNKNQIFIGKIGYQLNKNIQHLENETFTLIAENQVSSNKCIITIININDQQIDNRILSKLFILLGVIVILYFLYRRMQLKYKQQNNQRNHQILTNNSKLDL